MVDSNDLNGPMKVDDDLNTALGTETLADTDIAPSFDNAPGSSADTHDMHASEIHAYETHA